jgi:hypothetical protein
MRRGPGSAPSVMTSGRSILLVRRTRHAPIRSYQRAAATPVPFLLGGCVSAAPSSAQVSVVSLGLRLAQALEVAQPEDRAQVLERWTPILRRLEITAPRYGGSEPPQ